MCLHPCTEGEESSCFSSICCRMIQEMQGLLPSCSSSVLLHQVCLKGRFPQFSSLAPIFLGDPHEVLEKEASSGQKSPSCLCSSGCPCSHTSPQAATRILLKILAQFFPQSVTSSRNPTAAAPDEQVLLCNRFLGMPTFPST